MSILCCQKAFNIIQNLQHIFWTWVWPPPPFFEQCSKKLRIWWRGAPLSSIEVWYKSFALYFVSTADNISQNFYERAISCNSSPSIHLALEWWNNSWKWPILSERMAETFAEQTLSSVRQKITDIKALWNDNCIEAWVAFFWDLRCYQRHFGK